MVSASRPSRDPEPARDADVAHQHAPVEQALPGRGLVAELAEQHEVGVGVDHVQAQAADLGDQPVALHHHVPTVASTSSACARAALAAAWVSPERW